MTGGKEGEGEAMGGAAMFTFTSPVTPLPPLPQENFAVFMLDAMKEHGDKTAVIHAEEPGERTYKSLVEEVPALGSGLVARGVKPGDVVMLYTANHIDDALMVLAIVYVGAVCVMADGHLNVEEISRMIDKSGAKWVVTVSGPNVERVERATRVLPVGALSGLWLMDREPTSSLASSSSSIYPCLTDLLLEAPHVPPYPVGAAAPDTPAMIFFSSGTMGLPKGSLLSHTNVLLPYASSRYLLQLAGEKAGVEAEAVREAMKERYSRCLLSRAVKHMYGFVSVMAVLEVGATVVLMNEFAPRKFLSAVEKYEITVSPLVPYMLEALLRMPLAEYNLETLQTFICSTAPLNPATKEAIVNKMGIDVSDGYGMTEAVSISSDNPVMDESCPGSVGHVMPYSEVKIISTDGTGEVVQIGQEGELCVRSPSVMMRYVNDPQATAHTVDAEGWIHTHDLGYFDAHGCLFITGRLKDQMKVQGFQVSPRELEVVLEAVPGVQEVAVIGVPHPRTGEAPRAYVVLDPSSAITPADLKRAVAQRISSPYKQLIGGVQVVDQLPRNHVGKVIKRQLKEAYVRSRAKL